MRPTPARDWHYVRPNETTRIPRRHIFLDVEADETRVHNGRIQTWRLAVACFWRQEKGRNAVEYTLDFDEAATLWGAVSNHARRDARTVVWTHNLGYDVRVADAFNELPALGWRLTGHNLAPRGTWLEWRRDKSTLVMVDSASVYPTTLAAVGKAFGMGKVQLPHWTDDREAWLARCRQDVTILRAAVLAYLRWLEDSDLGNWQMTGAGQAWATFRHKFMTHKMLVHDDPQALAAERRAMWAGRCEAYWHGTLDRQVVHEWDFSLAYARIAATTPVPVRLVGPLPDGYDWRSTLDNSRVGLLAEIEVTTDLPVVPAEVDGRIAWPVGTFTTTLWDIEISAALRSGATVRLLRGWLYKLRPALAAWATWVIGQLETDEEECPTWTKLTLKMQARALVGRMAMTYTGWEHFATAPTTALRQSTVYDRDRKTTTTMLQVGTEVWECTGRQEWSQSMPMVTGYIQAACRVRLWDLLSSLPGEAVIYADTDSILTTDRWLSTVDAVAKQPKFQGLRLKRSWDGFAIYGPRQIRTGNEVRISGLPRRARRVGRHEYDGDVWESLAGSLRGGRADRVVIRDRHWHVEGVDHRRVSAGVGWTRPRRLGSGQPR